MYLHDLKKKMLDELMEVAQKRELSAGDLEMAHKLTDTVKNIDKILMLEDSGYSRRGYSRDDNWRGGASYDGEGSYEGGGSYARGGYSRRGYSRDEGRDRMTRDIEEMMQGADQRQKEILQRAVHALREA